MRKRLSKVVFTIVASLFIGVATVNADTVCTYRKSGDGTHVFKISFNNSGVSNRVSYIGSGIDINGTVLYPNGEREATNLVNVQVKLTNNTCPTSVKISKDYRNIVSASQSGDYQIMNYVSPSNSNTSSNSNTTSNSSSNSGTGNTSNETPGWLSSEKVSCGNIGQIPAKGPEIVHMFILIAQIAVPIILVILGMIDFAKGIMSQKEDDIKKGQKTFINRLIMGAVIFFIVALVKLLVGIVVDNTGNRNNIIACIDCFVNNDCN